MKLFYSFSFVDQLYNCKACKLVCCVNSSASNESVPETKPASSGGLFEDDDNEDDLFGSNAKSSSNSR